MGVLARLLAPVARREIYPSGSTRIAASETDLELRTSDGAVLRGWLVNPGRRRAIVYYGGNSEALDWLVPELGTRFPDHTSYLVAYRGFGASDGRPSQEALTRDGLAVLDHAAAAHPEAPVDVVGRSLGSGVAVQVAVRRPIGRLVLVTPFDSVVEVARAHFSWLPVRLLIADQWDSAAVASQVRSDVLVLRAGRDTVIPPRLTDRLIRALPREPTVVDLPAWQHNDLHEDPAYWSAIEEFLAPDRVDGGP